MKPVLIGLALCTSAPALAASSERFPDKPVRMIVATPPGTATDYAARLISAKLGATLGQPVMVDNRAGAGVEAAAAAQPNGYTLLIHGRDIEPGALVRITRIATQPLVLVASAGAPWRDLKELVSSTRTHPGKFNYASTGIGSPGHIAMELFKESTGIKLQHVPYKGGSAVTFAVQTNEVQAAFLSTSAAANLAHSAKARQLAVAAPNRSTLNPAIPTVHEAIGTSFSYEIPLGIFAPIKMPQALRSQLRGQIWRAVSDREIQDQLLKAGWHPAKDEGDAGNTNCGAAEAYCKCQKQCVKTGTVCPGQCAWKLD